jgi:hypothetical protein
MIIEHAIFSNEQKHKLYAYFDSLEDDDTFGLLQYEYILDSLYEKSKPDSTEYTLREINHIQKDLLDQFNDRVEDYNSTFDKDLTTFIETVRLPSGSKISSSTYRLLGNYIRYSKEQRNWQIFAEDTYEKK